MLKLSKEKLQEMKKTVDNSGYMRDPHDLRDFLYLNTLKYRSVAELRNIYLQLPSKVDYTAEMSPVKDQQQLGSCVGFAVTAMKEWQEQKEHLEELKSGKKYKRKEKHYDLSESWIYWNSKKIDPWPEEEGTSIRYAMKVLNKIGVPTEKAWPYDDINFSQPKSWTTMIARWSLIKSYWRITSLPELKTALIKTPVPIGIGCYEEIFYVGSDGVVSYPANPSICYYGHAVCAIGYNDNKGLVKFKNSWGPDWGEKGYGYVDYNYIRDFMWDAWTSEDLSVTKEMLRKSGDLFSLSSDYVIDNNEPEIEELEV